MSTTAKNDKPIVHLRVFKGKTMAYDAKGNVLNPNQLVKLKYNTLEWNNFLKMLPNMGFSSVKVEKVLDSATEEEIVDVPKEITAAVEKVFKKEEKELSADEQKIEALKIKNEELEAKNKSFEERLKVLEKGGNGKTAPATNVDDAEMTELKAKFKSLSGKDAHRLVGKDKLKKDIEELEKAKK